MRKILICTDLDRTLIPNGRQDETPGVRDIFSRLVARDDVTLAYVSGRHRGLIQQAIKDYGLPAPDFAIADVGTTIYHMEGSAWLHWQPWEDDIGGDWCGHRADTLHNLVYGLPGLRMQELDKQNTHKLSYYVDLGEDSDAVIQDVEARLGANGIRPKVIWSVDEEQDVGLLDILPARASKRHAIEFLMASEHYDADHAVFSGDSGNDLDVILSPIHSTLVANADDDVRAAVAEADPDNTYIAQGGFFGLNGNYAAGILEGVAHFCPEFEPVIADLIPPDFGAAA